MIKQNNLRKFVYFILGTIFLLIGFVGVFLPLIPTTPFLLLTSFFYLKSSNKFYNWLVNHKIFGPYIYNYLKYRAVSLRVKIYALIFLWISIILSMILINKLIVYIILLLIISLVSFHIIKLKTLKK